jgi:hypothetical protein
MFGEFVGVLFIPSPFDRVPTRSGNTKEGFQLIAVARQRRDSFIASWKEDPVTQIVTATHIEQAIDGFLFVAQIRHFDSARGVTRERRDRLLIIQDTDRDSASSQASGDTQPWVLATNNEGTHGSLWNRSPAQIEIYANSCQ